MCVVCCDVFCGAGVSVVVGKNSVVFENTRRQDGEREKPTRAVMREDERLPHKNPLLSFVSGGGSW